ncbi:MAG TPA: glycosyltransferase family A protein [Candidatus Limnocylindrales bacterium]|nr:glycosyltransferase family A protein [Candidatus Limnocylindrales bacterium]
MSMTESSRESTEARVSVVIPTRDRRRSLVEAIDSVLSQDVDGVEIIVVDDGAADDTASFVRRTRAAVAVVRIPPGGGRGRARNAGIRRARAPLVAFLDADDIWLPGKLARQLDQLAAHPEIAVAYTNAYRQEVGRILPRTRFDDFPPRASPPHERGEVEPPASRADMARATFGACVRTSSVVARRAVFDAGDLFDETLAEGDDRDLWSRLSERHVFGWIDTPLVVERACDEPLAAARA